MAASGRKKKWSAGEVVISDAIWPDVAGELKAERRALSLKGIDGPVIAHVVRVER